MEYFIDEDGKERVNLYKRQVPWPGPDFRPKAIVMRDPQTALAEGRGPYQKNELTICGLSGGPLKSTAGRRSWSWRCEE